MPWRSYSDVKLAPKAVKDKIREQHNEEPIAVIQLKIYGTSSGQSTLSVGVSENGPFAAFQQLAAAGRQRASQDIYKVASRELADGLRLLGEM